MFGEGRAALRGWVAVGQTRAVPTSAKCTPDGFLHLEATESGQSMRLLRVARNTIGQKGSGKLGRWNLSVFSESEPASVLIVQRTSGLWER